MVAEDCLTTLPTQVTNQGDIMQTIENRNVLPWLFSCVLTFSLPMSLDKYQ